MAGQVAQMTQKYSSSFRLPDDTLEKLRDLSRRTGLSQAFILRMLIEQAHTSWENKNVQILDVLGIG